MSKNPATIGGDFNEGLGTVRQNGRHYHTPSFSDDGIGFRVVCESSNRVRRGGSWYVSAQVARMAYRGSYVPTGRYGDLGFRLAREGA